VEEGEHTMRRISVILAITVAIVILAVGYVADLAQWPTATVQAANTGAHTAQLDFNVVASAGAGPHPTWVQYQTRDFNAHRSATSFRVPADTWVTVDVHQYDSSTTLRNPFFGLVQGVRDDVAYLNGKAFQAVTPDLPSHTFTIPELDVNVPLPGVASGAPATAFNTIRFTFYSGHAKRVYSWQCFDPCGWGLDGNGGPMQTYGFMDGQITVY